MTYNYDDKRRCELLGIKYPANWGYGGCINFEGLNKKRFDLLLEENFIDPDDSQNESPTAKEFKDFMDRYPDVTAHGYAISPDRCDCRITIEGISYNGSVSKEMMKDFIDMCRYADEFVCENNCLYCWYD